MITNFTFKIYNSDSLGKTMYDFSMEFSFDVRCIRENNTSVRFLASLVKSPAIMADGMQRESKARKGDVLTFRSSGVLWETTTISSRERSRKQLWNNKRREYRFSRKTWRTQMQNYKTTRIVFMSFMFKIVPTKGISQSKSQGAKMWLYRTFAIKNKFNKHSWFSNKN